MELEVLVSDSTHFLCTTSSVSLPKGLCLQCRSIDLTFATALSDPKISEG